MTEDKDKSFDEYLQDDSGLSRHYQQANNETQPPAELDTKILAESRKAVEAKPRIAHSPFSNNWAVPTSLAAVLVISVSLVTLMKNEVRDPIILQDNRSVFQDRLMEEDNESTDKKRANLESSVTKSMSKAKEKRTSSTTGARALREMQAEQRQKSAEKFRRSETIRGVMSQKKDNRSKGEPLGLTNESLDIASSPSEIVVEGKLIGTTQPAAIQSEFALGSDMISAEEWLEQIAELRQEGKHEEAEASLRHFKELYPDYPINKKNNQP